MVLAILTGVYAWRTHDISKATKEQANASAEMARAMREERLAADRPYILVEFFGPTPLALEGARMLEPSGGEDWNKDYAMKRAYELINVGQGPAKDIETSVVHSAMPYGARRKATLRPGGGWKERWNPAANGTCS